MIIREKYLNCIKKLIFLILKKINPFVCDYSLTDFFFIIKHELSGIIKTKNVYNFTYTEICECDDKKHFKKSKNTAKPTLQIMIRAT